MGFNVVERKFIHYSWDHWNEHKQVRGVTAAPYTFTIAVEICQKTVTIETCGLILASIPNS
jgi:hypothetical protein